MKAVHHNDYSNTLIGFVSGLIGGALKVILAMDANTMKNIVEAGLTALICGFAGVAGKELYLFIKKKIKK